MTGGPVSIGRPTGGGLCFGGGAWEVVGETVKNVSFAIAIVCLQFEESGRLK